MAANVTKWIRDRLAPPTLATVLAWCGGGLMAVMSMGASGDGCSFGGDNQNEMSAGNENGGVSIDIGDIAVAPSGKFIAFAKGGVLAVGWTDTGAVDDMPVLDPSTLAFSKTRPVVYVASRSDLRLHAIDVEKAEELWSFDLSFVIDPLMAVSSDDQRLVVASDQELRLLAAQTGDEVVASKLPGPPLDVRILPDDARAVVVPWQPWETQAAPSTQVTVLSLADGAETHFDVPNCSSEIAVASSGTRAFLAPVACKKDPISYLDLTPGAEGFVKNLPGFGPVAIASGGATAVGFLDTESASSLPPPGDGVPLPASPRYQLMLIDTSSLDYKFYPWGSNMPSYAVTPDGATLLVDDAFGQGHALLFDTASRTYRHISGPPVTFDTLAISSDSRHAYVLPARGSRAKRGLYDLDIVAGTATEIDPGFLPLNLNLSPDDQTLFLRENSRTICVFSLATRVCENRISVNGTATASP